MQPDQNRNAMPKMLIDLSTEDAAKLRDYAAEHGHKVKPFVEYLVRMQIGSAPPPSVRPVKFTAKSEQEQDREEKPTERKPAKVQPEATAKERPAQGMPRKRDLSKFSEKVSAQVFTDGTEYMLNRFGTRTFYQTLQEAEDAREGKV